MTQIAAADRSAMDSLYGAAVQAGLKTAGIDQLVDKDLPANTATAFEDHEGYLKTLSDVLADDKTSSIDPNDPKLD